MSARELKRLGVMARVEKEALNLVNAAEILGLSYRQAKRIWRRYQDEGAEGLQHRSVGRESGRRKAKQFRLKVLRLVRRKYSGEVGERFGPTLAAMGAEETIWTAAGVLRSWIEQYGVPVALYTDWKTVYVKEATEQQLLRGEAAMTQFGRMCERLGIRIIAANSPQAKGRVERNHGTHQDRLVKKLRRNKVRTYESANAYLTSEYLPDHNRRFAHAAVSPEDYHHQKPSRAVLDEVFRLETERVIGNDWVVRYENRFLQVNRKR